MRNLVAFLAGALFSVGLVVSGMTQPAKVVNFLDLAGNWDPSLALVMMSAIPVSAFGYFLAKGIRTPILGDAFPTLPIAVDRRLIVGAVIFGVGWGLGGYCPGPGMVALASPSTPSIAFAGSMVVGMAVFELIERVLRNRRAAEVETAPLTADG